MDRPPKKRSIDFLTPDQLRRKREGNVKAQRALREKRKAEMEALQSQTEALKAQNRDLAAKLLAAKSALVMRGIMDVVANSSSPPATESTETETRSEAHAETHVETDNTTPTLHMLLDSDMAMPFAPWGDDELGTLDVLQMMDQTLHQNMDENLPTFDLMTGLPPIDPALSLQQQQQQQQPPLPPLPSLPPTIPFTTIATDQVWSIIPKHTAPVCMLDHALLNLIHQRRPQDNAPEFQKHAFPSVQSLLNSPPAGRDGVNNGNNNNNDDDGLPERSEDENQDQDPKFPVSSTIVRSLRHIMTMAGLPEQIAMLQNVSAIVRWLIAPTRGNYDAMPLYLRPTATQLVIPHPPWVDVLPWSAARDWFCRRPSFADLHHYTLLSTICNETLSLNWPYQDADILLHCTRDSGDGNGSVDEILLNPIFDRHIQDARNWTVGPRMTQV
ncbi:hypothetical protein SBRCBS47491_009323 [Sporothrix bragantina]|uniref:BZIP domain-containing protein n=1 Tax=Sporothrix bragantina TaxID=671064 RepID=A0ABP0CTR0_9PEZI